MPDLYANADPMTAAIAGRGVTQTLVGSTMASAGQ